MKNMFMRFVKEEQGQDLIEYTLLMAFIALASAAIFINAGKSISGIWGVRQQPAGGSQYGRQLGLPSGFTQVRRRSGSRRSGITFFSDRC